VYVGLDAVPRKGCANSKRPAIGRTVRWPSPPPSPLRLWQTLQAAAAPLSATPFRSVPCNGSPEGNIPSR
jgi:hypothetical protein